MTKRMMLTAKTLLLVSVGTKHSTVPLVPDGPAAEEEPKGAEEVSGNDEKHQDVYDGIEAARRREAKVETENRRLDEKNREIPGDGDGEDVELEAAQPLCGQIGAVIAQAMVGYCKDKAGCQGFGIVGINNNSGVIAHGGGFRGVGSLLALWVSVIRAAHEDVDLESGDNGGKLTGD
ncbi:predicted protein [Chaetomium globosum CBS 148.51]|uniref:Uncharacterized protein n=1 Tax=Chaetomium globosum (strain ATCC 6205 / CBS 148.51 / DSM 1962 / NBRC 6347 / NRRL 1970) TaxID=306901 RepID=Q2HCR7_CHAGB|nr:uncharacterized protein CHGG_01987 [Chaetomium globosum CBS 148.51]EAQ93752.1 predicted protein [Chaetomium globosum CBS 148.51]